MGRLLWRVYYGDGATRGSDEDRATMPRRGVVAVVYPDPETGRAVLHRWDWYYLRRGDWWGSDVFGLLDQMMHYADEIELVLQGRTFTNDRYRAVLARAFADPDFPPRSASKVGETP